MDLPLNLRLMTHWQNYFIILLMLLIAGIALDLINLSMSAKYSNANTGS